MSNDAELERLKSAQNSAFQRKLAAQKTLDSAWDKRSRARDDFSRAYDAKQRAYEVQDSSWQDYQRVRSYNGPRIEQLNSQQQVAYQNMCLAFDSASSAYNMRDGESASRYAAEGRSYKEESKGYVSERRALVQEIRNARDSHEPTKLAFQRAKSDFTSAKQVFDRAKAEHEQAQSEFKQAKADFDRAKRAFHDRLEKLKSENKRRKQDKRSLAEQAGIPYQYRDNVWVSKELNGTVNIYFGGVGKPNGPGHGHYVMDSHGNVTYSRDPFDPHGSQNFKDGGWNERIVGTIDGHEATVRKGWGYNEGHTLIADGSPSGRSFDKRHEHNHYGKKHEDDSGYVEDSDGDRGYYTGPGH